MTGYEGNVERFTGFAGEYDRHRWRPPAVLRGILLRYAAVDRASLVVDLGCGTGISARFWADCAERVVGIDPSPDMLAQAESRAGPANVEYLRGHGHATGLPDSGADLVTASQSFHWMEPETTLAEVARVLRPGGVFCAYHYHSLPVTGIAELEQASIAAGDAVDRLEAEHDLKTALEFHGKDTHAESLARSGVFRLVRSFGLLDTKSTSAENMVGGFESFGAVQSLRKRGCSDEELGLTRLRDAARKHLGEGEPPIWVSYEVHVGITGFDDE